MHAPFASMRFSVPLCLCGVLNDVARHQYLRDMLTRSISRVLLMVLPLLVAGCSTKQVSIAGLVQQKWTDAQGQAVMLGPAMGAKATVFVTLDPDCPYCQFYAHDLEKVAEQYASDSVKLIGIYAGPYMEAAAAAKFAEQAGFTFPQLMDPGCSLCLALHARVVNLEYAFRRIVFAQVRIAGINAILTALYLVVILPLSGVHLPFTKTMIALTFFVGLLPVVGNLISNSILVIVGLSHSLYIALASLLFLIVIHKLEYFLNAKIIGSHINARVWELLVAMLALETVFGIPGVIAAPVLYAYIKKELRDRGLV